MRPRRRPCGVGLSSVAALPLNSTGQPSSERRSSEIAIAVRATNTAIGGEASLLHKFWVIVGEPPSMRPGNGYDYDIDSNFR